MIGALFSLTAHTHTHTHTQYKAVHVPVCSVTESILKKYFIKGFFHIWRISTIGPDKDDGCGGALGGWVGGGGEITKGGIIWKYLQRPYFFLAD